MSYKTRTIQRQKDIHRRLISYTNSIHKTLRPEYIIKIQKLIMYEVMITVLCHTTV